MTEDGTVIGAAAEPVRKDGSESGPAESTTLSASEGGAPYGFKTLPRLTDEDDSKKLDHISYQLEFIAEQIGNKEEKNEQFESLTRQLENFSKAINGFNGRMENQFDYILALKDKLDKKETEVENAMLRKTLMTECRNLNVTCENFSRDVETELKNIGTQMEEIDLRFVEKSRQLNDSAMKRNEEFFEGVSNKLINVEATFEDQMEIINNQMGELTSFEKNVRDALDEFRKDMTKASENEFKILEGRCREILEKTDAAVEQTKLAVIDFLKTCKTQNQALIKKIPEGKHKFSWYDGVYMAVGISCVVCTILGLVMK